MKAIRYILLLLLSLVLLNARADEQLSYGFGSRSYEVEKEERTSLDLTCGKPFCFDKGFSYADLSFNSDSTKLIDFTVNTDTGQQSAVVRTYTLVNPADLEQTFNSRIDYKLYLLLSILMFILIVAILRMNKKTEDAKETLPLEEDNEE